MFDKEQNNCIKSKLPAALYLVATPIGNLQDISKRAIDILQTVDIIAVENTNHSKFLLTHFNIHKPLLIVHDYNENKQVNRLLDKIETGQSIALISDAGTPLISDPGYHLVAMAHQKNIKVTPIPGACALISALISSGLPTDRFCFEGFLPNKISAKTSYLQNLKHETRTMIFYEAPHRLMKTLDLILEIFGEDRLICLARELTKKFETLLTGKIIDIIKLVKQNLNQQKGEIVLVIAGYKENNINKNISPQTEQILRLLLAELPVSQAVKLAAKITGVQKRLLYQHANLNLDSN